MNKYFLKKIKERNKINRLRLLEKGHTINNIVFFETDYYNIKDILDNKIKDIKKIELSKIEKEDPFYFKYHTEDIYKDINKSDCLFGDLWRIGTKNKIIYLTITTPHLRDLNENFINYEISNLIKKHYHYLFGYENLNFKTIINNFELKEDVSPEKLIEKWVEQNKNSSIYEYYKSLIIKNNDLSLNQKDISFSFYKYDKDCAELIIPFKSDLTYPELFNMILNNKIKKTIHLNEDYIEKDFTEDLKDFLLQFKTKRYKKRKRK